jgi:hypothetical protein
VRWLTRTAVLTALLIAVQWATAGTQAFAGQYITGSLVNCVLAVAALFGGLWAGVTVALLSPFCAFLLGIGPALIQLVPCIALGNTIYVVALWLLAGRLAMPVWKRAVSVAIAATAKFLTLYLAVVKVVIPVMGDALKAPQVQKFTAMFSLPQLVTALAGGALAMLILPVLRKAIQK